MNKSTTRQLEQAALLLNAGKIEQAQTAFEAVLAKEPNSMIANLGLATLFNHNNRVLHAWQLLDEMWQQIRALPTDSIPASLRAEVLAQLGLALEGMQKFSEAKARYHEALALFPSEALRKRIANMETRLVLRSEPVPLLHEVARFHLRQQNPSSAEKIYKALLRHDPNDGVALDGLANLLCQRGLLDQALTLIQRAIVLYPTNAEYFHTLAIVFQLKQDPAKAVTFYKKALALKPDHEATLRALSNALMALGQADEAARYQAAAEALVVQQPGTPEPAALPAPGPASTAKARKTSTAAKPRAPKAKAATAKPKAQRKGSATSKAGKAAVKPKAKTAKAKTTKAGAKTKPEAAGKAKAKSKATTTKARPAGKSQAKVAATKAKPAARRKPGPGTPMPAKATAASKATPKAAVKNKTAASKAKTATKAAPTRSSRAAPARTGRGTANSKAKTKPAKPSSAPTAKHKPARKSPVAGKVGASSAKAQAATAKAKTKAKAKIKVKTVKAIGGMAARKQAAGKKPVTAQASAAKVQAAKGKLTARARPASAATSVKATSKSASRATRTLTRPAAKAKAKTAAAKGKTRPGKAATTRAKATGTAPAAGSKTRAGTTRRKAR